MNQCSRGYSCTFSSAHQLALARRFRHRQVKAAPDQSGLLLVHLQGSVLHHLGSQLRHVVIDVDRRFSFKLPLHLLPSASLQLRLLLGLLLLYCFAACKQLRLGLGILSRSSDLVLLDLLSAADEIGHGLPSIVGLSVAFPCHQILPLASHIAHRLDLVDLVSDLIVIGVCLHGVLERSLRRPGRASLLLTRRRRLLAPCSSCHRPLPWPSHQQ
mmetsp:Transcript_27924/g.69356  ORF Transcript_27924/g.69356 Transcript_27924/m.69356 type:complete len:214 (+) Transcript_27924:113-754(+)